jgi:hypothetical protein
LQARCFLEQEGEVEGTAFLQLQHEYLEEEGEEEAVEDKDKEEDEEDKEVADKVDLNLEDFDFLPTI